MIPWQGGPDSAGWLYESRDRTLGVWAGLHGCASEAAPLPTPYDGGSLRLSCSQYPGCDSGALVAYCMYDGHHGGWPNQPEADAMTWAFFTGGAI